MTEDVHGNNAQLPEQLVTTYRKLRQALLFTSRFQWFFAVFGDSIIRQKIIDTLSADINSKDVDSKEFNQKNTPQKEITQKVISLADIKDIVEFENLLQESAKDTSCLHIVDTKHLFESEDSNWPNLFNLHREAISQKAPVNLVFWMDDEHLTFLAKNAPDFWNWRSAVYKFVNSSDKPTSFATHCDNQENATALSTQSKIEKLSNKEIQSNKKKLSSKEKQRLNELERRFDQKPANNSADANLLLELANLYVTSIQFAAAESTLRLARGIYITEGNSEQESIANFTMAKLFINTAQFEKAESYFQALILKNQSVPNLLLASTYRELGAFERRLGKIESARKNLNRALEVYQELNSTQGVANTLYYIADLENLTGNSELAKQTSEKAEVLFRQLDDKLGLANILRCLADIDVRFGKKENAKQMLLEAIELYGKVDDDLGRANTLLRLGDLEANNGFPDHAKDKYLEAINVFEYLHENLGLGNTLGALGNLELQQESLESARKNFEKAEAILEFEKDELGQANIKKSLGRLEIKNNEPEAALRYFDSAIDLYSKAKAPYGLIDSLITKKQCLLALNSLTEETFNQLFERAKQAALELKNPRTSQKVEQSFTEFNQEK